MGAATERAEHLITDGDPHLMLASKAAVSGIGVLGAGSPAGYHLCRFHTVNISLLEVVARHGFNGQERDIACDVKDCAHKMFRTCETHEELMSMHQGLCKMIESGTTPEGLCMSASSWHTCVGVLPWEGRVSGPNGVVASTPKKEKKTNLARGAPEPK